MLAGLLLLVVAEGQAAGPYVDPTQLRVPWPKHSHYRQPWRAWLETVPADTFLTGLGVAYNWSVERTNHDVQMRLLAGVGFSRIRVEVGWSNVAYDTDDLTDEAKSRLSAITRAAARAGIRPLILLNAHHGIPGPARETTRRVTADAAAGSREIGLDDVEGLRPGYSGLSNLTGTKMAEVLVTGIDPVGRRAFLSKPLPVALKAGQDAVVHTLKYRPFFEPGTPAYEETLGGWLAYVRAVVRTVTAAGVSAFDVEVWNELTFGSDFLTASNYYDPKPPAAQHAVLLEGGRLWELGRRTVEMLAREFPSVVPIWGFSNTTFFATPVRELPRGFRGQSYHPYLFLDYRSPADEQYGFQNNLEQYAPPAPPYRVLMPETAATFLRTESLARLINPADRRHGPPDSPSFDHFMTEFGFSPQESGIQDPSQAQLLKTKVYLRGSLFWLNKGLRGIWFFSDFETMDTRSYDVLPPDTARLLADPADPDAAVTPPLQALRRVVRLFKLGKGAVTRPRALGARIAVRPGTPGVVFAGNGRHPPLTFEDVLAVLPFQLDDRTFLVATYVMSRNILEPVTPRHLTLTLSNVDGRAALVSGHDPLRGEAVQVEVRSRTRSTVEVALPVTDYPYLLLIQETQRAGDASR